MSIKEERQALGLSQIKLAKLAKMSRFRLYLAENGYIALTQSELEKINQVFFEIGYEGHTEDDRLGGEL